MKPNSILLALVVLFMISSCKEEKKSTETLSQMKQVMAIHDEVMPKMSTMAKLAGELSSKEDSTKLGKQYKEARKDLQAARDAMMVWMQDFGNKFDSEEIMNGKELSPQKQIWLNEEEEKMTALKNQINTSIEKAEKLLNKSR